MTNLLRGLALLIAAAMFASVPAIISGQGSSREDRIRAHQERIQKILQESAKRKAEAEQQREAQANPPAAPGTAADQNASPAAARQGGAATQGQAQPTAPTANKPGSPIPTGPIQSARMTPPIKQATPTPAAAAPQTARSESRTILLFHPLDSIVEVGEQFKTGIIAETKEGEIDEVSVLLHYPRHSLSPLALDHAAIDPFVKNKIDYEFNPDEGTIYFHAKLKAPMRFPQAQIFSIVWEALEANEGAVISYRFGPNENSPSTGLYLKGSNLLGTLPGSQDGVIKTTVQIIGPKSKPTITKLESNDFMIGAKPPVTYDDRPEEQIILRMRGPEGRVQAGEVFDVPVYVRNPGEKRIDRLRLYVQFDPSVLQVVDYDTGNVVKRGVNIHDARARERFPFDFYRTNLVDNQKGTIEYEVSASTNYVRGSGRVATIRMKALKETPRAEIVLVQNPEGLSPTTSVSFMGETQLKAGGPVQSARALEGVAVQVSGTVVAEKSDPSTDVYNPFVSNLARRMRAAGQ